MFVLKGKCMRLFCVVLLLAIGMGCFQSERPIPSGASLDAILEQPDPKLRTQQFLAYLDRATGSDLPEIESAFNAARQKLDPVVCTLLAQWWVQFDPIGAFNDGLDLSYMDRMLWGGAVFQEWARIAPQAALDRALEIPESAGQEWRRTVALALVRGWMAGGADPALLLPFIQDLPLGRPQKESLDVLFGLMIYEGNFDEATALLEGMPEAGEGRALKGDAFRRMATVLTRKDPKRGLAWLEKHGSGPFGKNMAMRVASVWARNAGQPAVEWALRLPAETRNRDRIIQGAYRSWSAENPSGSQRWFEAQPFSADLQGILKLSILREARQNPAAAIARAEKIEDPGLRDEMLGVAGQIWINLDTEAANAWIAKANPSAAVEQAIRKPLPGQPAVGRPAGSS